MTSPVLSDMLDCSSRERRAFVQRDQSLLLRQGESSWRGPEGQPLAVLCREPLAPSKRLPVILLHGYRGSRHSWECSCRSFPNYLVSRGFSVICPELRGSGGSRALGAGSPEKLADWVDDFRSLVRLVTERSGQPVSVVAHSLGGLVTALVAAEEGVVASIVTLATPLLPGRGRGAARFGARVWLGLTRRPGWRKALAAPKVDRWLRQGRIFLDRPWVPVRARSAWPGHMEREGQEEHDQAARAEPVAPLLLRDLCHLALEQPPTGLDVFGSLDSLCCPVLSIAANRDEVVPPVVARTFFDGLGTAHKEWRFVGEAEQPMGHVDLLLGREAPTQVWPMVAEWLERR